MSEHFIMPLIALCGQGLFSFQKITEVIKLSANLEAKKQIVEDIKAGKLEMEDQSLRLI